MAFLPINEENENAPSGQTTNNPSAATPPVQSGSAGAGITKAGAAPNSGTPNQFGSSASKLGDYLSSNAPQITQQADNIAGGLNNQYQQVNTDIGNAANQFGQQVQAGYTPENQSLVGQAAANPTQFASDPNNVSAFQSQYNDSYSGPTSYEASTPYSNVQNEVSQAVAKAGTLNNSSGLQNYIQGQEQNPTQAASTLDTLLVNGNPQASQTVQNAASQFQGLTPYLANTATAADQSVAQAQQNALNAKTYAQQQLNPVMSNFSSGITNGATAAQNAENAYNAQEQKFLSQATPLEQQLNQYAGTLTGAPTLQDYFAPVISTSQPVTTPITAANYATPEQYAEANALQTLLGNSATLPINQSTVSQAGTAPTNYGSAPDLNSILGKYAPAITEASAAAHYNANRLGSAPAENAAEQRDNNSTDAIMKILGIADPSLAPTAPTNAAQVQASPYYVNAPTLDAYFQSIGLPTQEEQEK